MSSQSLQLPASQIPSNSRCHPRCHPRCSPHIPHCHCSSGQVQALTLAATQPPNVQLPSLPAALTLHPALPPGALTPTSKLLRRGQARWGRRGGRWDDTWGRGDDDVGTTTTTRRRRRRDDDAATTICRRDDDATRRRRRRDDNIAAATSARVAGASQLHHRCIKQGGASARDQVQDR